jgi:hypothetical protein
MSTNISDLMSQLEQKLPKARVQAIVLDLLAFGQSIVYGASRDPCVMETIRHEMREYGFNELETNNLVTALIVAGERTVVARKTEEVLSRSREVTPEFYGTRDKRMDN